MIRRVVPALLGVLVIVASAATLAGKPATGAPRETVDYVIVVGMAGLRWEDIDPVNTPALWAMAEQGSIGSLSVRSAREPTCPSDGWLTLGAGNYAAWHTDEPVDPCPPLTAQISQPDQLGAHVDQQRTVVRHNSDALPWGAVPGALAESVRCTVAIGPGAAVAAARPFGRVDQYEPELPSDPADLLSSCVLSIVDAGTITDPQPPPVEPVEPPESAAPPVPRPGVLAADRTVAKVLAARPPDSLVLVAGVSDTDAASRLHVAIAHGPGWEGGWLTSASTGRDGYLQLVDLAPTALAALGKPAPRGLFAGQSASSVPGRTGELTTEPADADREAGAQRGVAGWFFGILTVVQLLVLLAVIPLLRRAHRHAGPGGPAGVPRRYVAAAELLLVGSALAIPAALVADAVPWWRFDLGGLIFAGVVLAALAAVTALVVIVRPYRLTLGPLALVAGFAALTVAVDVLTGAELQLNGVAGYSALEGGRYAGLGTVGLGVLIAGTLLSAGFLAQQVRRSWRPAVVILVGGIGVMLVGSPYLGADAVGAVAMTAGVCIAAAISTGGWLTFARLAWATLAGLAVTLGFAVLDLRRPPEDRGSLGRLLTQLSDGSGGLVMHRTGAENAVAFGTSPLTVLAVVAGLFAWAVLLRDWGGLKRLYGIYPAMRAALAGIAVATVIAGVFGGAALNVAGAAAATAVPLAALSALRVLDHATDRTRPPVAPECAEVIPAGGAAGPPRGDGGDGGKSSGAATRSGGASRGASGEVLAWSPVDRVI
jgi:hypothetical protein